MKYILNSCVITSPGLYRYNHISAEKAKNFLADGEAISTIGYEETAVALSSLVGRNIPVNRIMITMQPGDQALVFRMVFPPGSPRINIEDKGKLTPDYVLKNCELGLLEKIE